MFKIIKNHTRDAWGGYHHWIVDPDADTVWRDRAGGLRGATTPFIALRCNNTQCYGKAIVPQFEVTAEINAAMTKVLNG